MHPRTTVRNLFLSKLKEITQLKSNVFVSRVYPVSALPVALIYTSDEQCQPMSLDSDRSLRREITVTVEILTTGGDEEVDVLCEIVEQKIAADTFLGGSVEDVNVERTQIDQTGDGERPRILAKIDFLAVMFAPELN